MEARLDEAVCSSSSSFFASLAFAPSTPPLPLRFVAVAVEAAAEDDAEGDAAAPGQHGGWETGGSDAVPAPTGNWASEQANYNPSVWDNVGKRKPRKHIDAYDDSQEEKIVNQFEG